MPAACDQGCSCRPRVSCARAASARQRVDGGVLSRGRRSISHPCLSRCPAVLWRVLPLVVARARVSLLARVSARTPPTRTPLRRRRVPRPRLRRSTARPMALHSRASLSRRPLTCPSAPSITSCRRVGSWRRIARSQCILPRPRPPPLLRCLRRVPTVRCGVTSSSRPGTAASAATCAR